MPRIALQDDVLNPAGVRTREMDAPEDERRELICGGCIG